MDRRGQANRPDAGWVLDSELGTTEAVGVGAGQRAMVGQRPAALGEGKERGRPAAANPADRCSDAARVLDEGVAGLRRQAPAPCGAWPPP